MCCHVPTALVLYSLVDRARKNVRRRVEATKTISPYSQPHQGTVWVASEMDTYDDDPLHQYEGGNASERPLSTRDKEQDISEGLYCQDRESVVGQQHSGEEHEAKQTARLDSHSCGISEPTQDTSIRRYVPSFDIPGHEAFIDPIEPPTLTLRSSAQRNIDEIEEIELEERRAMEPMPTQRPSERESTTQGATGHINTYRDQ